jgi:hypothetical protein
MIKILKSKVAAYISLSCITISLLFASCKRETTIVDPPLPCSATLHGYVFTDSLFNRASASSSWGAINPATLATTPTTTVMLSGYTNQVAYNTVDSCCYVFQINNSTRTSNLLKITTAGIVSTYTSASPQYLEGLVYNPVTNKLYCLRFSASLAEVVEITTSGTSFTATPVATTVQNTNTASPVTSTVNNATGDMYFNITSFYPTLYSVEKYVPGSATTTVLAADTGRYMLGLRYNNNNNQLYAISVDTATGVNSFTNIDPLAGTVTLLAPLPFGVNYEFCSSVINPCSNRYIVSTFTSALWGPRQVAQLNMSGSVVQSDYTAGFYTGLVIKP